MKLVRFLVDDSSTPSPKKDSWGITVEDRLYDLGCLPAFKGTDILSIFTDWHAWKPRIEAAILESQPTKETVKLLSPVPEGGKLLCIGLNYRDHAIESGMEIPGEPVVFNKLAGTLCGPGASVPLPKCSSKVDYEAELVMVIGSRAWQVSEQDADKHIFGYTCGHDVSARDWQLGRPGGQWLLGKSFPNFAPVGPHIVPKEYIEDVGNLAISLRINGETMQNSSTQQLIFSPSELVSFLSQVCVLEAGDIIFTGTPPGVGAARKPPRFLQPGDECEVEIESIGVLTNRFE